MLTQNQTTTELLKYVSYVTASFQGINFRLALWEHAADGKTLDYLLFTPSQNRHEET